MNYLKISIVAFCMVLHSALAFSLNYTAYRSAQAPVMDGLANDSCWILAKWYDIKYDWSNGTDIIANNSFKGKFKVAWTADRLYVLAEITDDTIMDTRKLPTDDYWDDDCLEIFLDENHKNQGHVCHDSAYNAFAYHVAAFPRLENNDITTFDDPAGIHNVVDEGISCGPRLFNDNVKAKITKNGHVYTWEIEIKVFDDTFNENGGSIPVTLTANKVMGLAMAYCDDDHGNREHFIGTEPNHNDYDEADLPCYEYTNAFGAVTLNDTILTSKGNGINTYTNVTLTSSVWPNPVKDILHLNANNAFQKNSMLKIINVSGQTVLMQKMNNQQAVNVISLPQGVYILEATDYNGPFKQRFIKE